MVGCAVGDIHSSANGSHRRCRLPTKTKTPLHCKLVLSAVLPQPVLFTAFTLMLNLLFTAGPKRAARLLMISFRCMVVDDPASMYIAPPEFRATFSLKVASYMSTAPPSKIAPPLIPMFLSNKPPSTFAIEYPATYNAPPADASLRWNSLFSNRTPA